jgi:hypothetical protein
MEQDILKALDHFNRFFIMVFLLRVIYFYTFFYNAIEYHIQ